MDKEITYNSDKIYDVLLSCRIDIGSVDDLIYLLEDISLQKYMRQKRAGSQKPATSEQYTVFRKAYLITLFQQYVAPDDKLNLLLAVAGLLQGYDTISTNGNKKKTLQCRLAQYRDDAKESQSSSTLGRAERDTLSGISEQLWKRRGQEPLNLLEDALLNLGVQEVGNIPETITLPTLNYMPSSSEVQVDAETLDTSKTHKDPLHSDRVDDTLPRKADVVAPEDLSVPSQKERQSNAKWYRILPASLSLICLIASVCLFVASHNNENIIQEISVANSEISLYPGGYERLQIWTYPEDADWDELECHSDSSPWITASKTNDWADVNPWTDAWNVAAESNWTEELPYAGKVSVMGGKAIPVYVDVTVKTQEYKNDTGILNGTTNELDGAGEENSDALVNP